MEIYSLLGSSDQSFNFSTNVKEWTIRIKSMIYRIQVQYSKYSSWKQVVLNQFLILHPTKVRLLNFSFVVDKIECSIIESEQKRFQLKINSSNVEQLKIGYSDQHQNNNLINLQHQDIQLEEQAILMNPQQPVQQANRNLSQQIDQLLKKTKETLQIVQENIQQASLREYKNLNAISLKQSLQKLQDEHNQILPQYQILRQCEIDGKISELFQNLDEIKNVNKIDFIDEIQQNFNNNHQIENNSFQEIQLEEDEQEVVVFEDEENQKKIEIAEQNKDEDNLCVICMEMPKIYTLVPCGHLKYCEACSTLALIKKICFVCKSKCENRIKTYS